MAAQKPYYDFYLTDECKQFAERAGVKERSLDFNQSPEALAEHIMRECGIDWA